MHVWMYVCMYVCVYVCMYESMCVCVSSQTAADIYYKWIMLLFFPYVVIDNK